MSTQKKEVGSIGQKGGASKGGYGWPAMDQPQKLE